MQLAMCAVALIAVSVISSAWASSDLLDIPASMDLPSPVHTHDASDMVLKSQFISSVMSPEDRPHKMVIWCTDNTLVYSIILHVPGEGIRYTIDANSVRLDGIAAAHDAYIHEGDIKMDVIRSQPLQLGHDGLPLALYKHGSLMIPIGASGMASDTRITADMLYVAGEETVCHMDAFRPGPVGALFSVDPAFRGFSGLMYDSATAGVADFNSHLDGIGEDWHMDIVQKDTHAVNMTKLVDSMLQEDIALYLGPPDVYGLSQLAGFGDDLVALSCCGTSGFLDKPDNIFRTAPSDSSLASAFARLMIHNGIEVIIPVWVDDIWNNAYLSDLSDNFQMLGGTVDSGVMQENGKSLADLSEEVRDRIVLLSDTHGPEKVAVFSFPFEDVEFMSNMAMYEGSEQVRWFGTDYTALTPEYVEDPILSEFTSSVGYTTLQVETSGKDAVRHALADIAGRPPTHDIMASYETAWVLGLAMQHTQSTEPARIAGAIPIVASHYWGVLGDMTMNQNGDLANTSLEVWSVHQGQWVRVGVMR